MSSVLSNKVRSRMEWFNIQGDVIPARRGEPGLGRQCGFLRGKDVGPITLSDGTRVRVALDPRRFIARIKPFLMTSCVFVHIP